MTGRTIHPWLMNTCCCWWWSVDPQLAATKAPLGLWCLLSRSDHLSYGRWYCQGLPCTLEFDGQVAPKLKGWIGRISPQTSESRNFIRWIPMNRHLTNPSLPHRIWKGSFGFGEIPRKMAKQVFRWKIWSGTSGMENLSDNDAQVVAVPFWLKNATTCAVVTYIFFFVINSWWSGANMASSAGGSSMWPPLSELATISSINQLLTFYKVEASVWKAFCDAAGGQFFRQVIFDGSRLGGVGIQVRQQSSLLSSRWGHGSLGGPPSLAVHNRSEHFGNNEWVGYNVSNNIGKKDEEHACAGSVRRDGVRRGRRHPTCQMDSKTYVRLMGSLPPEEEERSVEQMSMFARRINVNGGAPYADFSLVDARCMHIEGKGPERRAPELRIGKWWSKKLISSVTASAVWFPSELFVFAASFLLREVELAAFCVDSIVVDRAL